MLYINLIISEKSLEHLPTLLVSNGIQWLSFINSPFDFIYHQAGFTIYFVLAQLVHSIIGTFVSENCLTFDNLNCFFFIMASTREENAYLIFRLSKLMQKSLEARQESDESKFDHYAYLAPVMKALLEKSR